MKAPKKPTISGGLKMLALPNKDHSEHRNLPVETSTKDLKVGIQATLKKTPTLIKSHLKLSAAHTFEANKGYINAIGCRSVFPDGPNIDFVPESNSFGGKVELWMLNITKGESFVVSFRVVCGFQGQWKLSSSETGASYVPITPAYQTIDFLIPKVDNDYGMALIVLQPEFSAYGSWVFKDVTVKKVHF